MKSMLNKRQKLNAPRRKAIALAVAMCFVGDQAWANPTGANVVRGTAAISAAGTTLTVANSPGAIINWHDFSIQLGETTVFNQVNAASAVLNRVTGGNISQILGTLKSNGQVYLINPSGILFGANSVIDVAGLVASTLNMTDADFLSGKKLFNADIANAGSVINHGEIKTPTGGFVYLLAPKVENNGIITTPSGEAILAAGNSVEIVDSVNPSQRVVVSAQSQDVNLSALMTQSNGNIFSVLNRGTVSANTVHQDATGRIFFKSAGSVQTTASSVIEAKGDTLNNGGTFIGFADTVGAYQGKIDARGKNGGFVETSGKYVRGLDLLDLNVRSLDSHGKGGTWLIDPFDIAIVSGSDLNSVSTISGITDTFTATGSPSEISSITIESMLDTGVNVIIDTVGVGTEAGIITFNDSITTSSATDVFFTLNADGDIRMNGNSITDTGAGKLTVNMLSDRDGVGAGGGFDIGVIDVAGDINLTANSGDLILDGVTSNKLLRGRNINIDLLSTNLGVSGKVVLNGGNFGASIQSSSGNITINANNDVVLTGGTTTNSDAFISAGGNLNISTGIPGITTQGALNLTGGFGGSATIVAGGDIVVNAQNGLALTGGSGINSEAVISSTGKVTVNTGGDVVLAAGSGATGKAVIESIGDDVKIEFKSSGNDLTLTGSSVGVTDGFAVIEAVAGDVEIKGDISAHSPNITLTGGSGAGTNNYAVIDADGTVSIEAVNITLQGGGSTSTNAKALIGTTLGSTSGNVSIQSTGNISLQAGTGNNSDAVIAAVNNVSIISKAANKSMTLTGGSAGTNNSARVQAGGDLFFETDSSSNALNVTINGGGGSSTNFAGFSANTISDFDTNTLTLNGGSAAKAYIATTNTTPTAYTIQTSDASGNPANVILNGNVGSAEIGGTNGAVAVTIEAKGVTLNGASGVAGIGATTNNAVAVNITATGANSTSVVLNGAGARIGNAGNGGANVTINATGIGGGLTMSNGAKIGSKTGGDILITGVASATGGGVQIINSEIKNGVDVNGVFVNGVGNINISGVGNGSGSSYDGVLMLGTSAIKTQGDITITGTGTASTLSGTGAAGVKIADSTNINSSAGNVLINGTGQSSAGNSFGVHMLNSAGLTIKADTGNVVIAGTSVVPTSVALDSATITASSGNVTLAASNNNLALESAQITAGNQVNLIAPNGNISQTLSGAILTPRLNASALNINLGSLLNNFNLALFDTANLINLGNSATGTVDYRFLQNTNWLDSDDSASVLNVTAENGLTLVGNGSPSVVGSNTGTVNFKGSSLKLTNGMQASADNFNIVANSIEMDQGSRIDANNLDVVANKISMDNATINATSNINILTKNLVMNNNSFIGGSSVNINSLPLAFKLAGDDATKQQVRALFARLTKDATVSLTDSFISADTNLNIAAGDVNLVGSGLFATNMATVVSGGNITLTGGSSNSAFISAGKEVLLVAGKQVILNSGASSARVEADSPFTLFMSFPLLASDGYVVDGVTNGITNGQSGFFVNGAPAILDTNFFVSYSGNLSQELLAFVTRTSNEQSISTNLVFKKDDKDADDKKDNQKGECS